ncbi:hypothetical protein HQ544_04815, partial [Candidatus Falkowbacteria bacterium]|nr:hypothetical protein [Candidatus Falkowbacteria bacterium]
PATTTPPVATSTPPATTTPPVATSTPPATTTPTVSSDINPKNISLSCSSGKRSVIIKWTNPETIGLESYTIYRSDKNRKIGSPVSPGEPYNWLSGLDSGKTREYTDFSIIPDNRNYYYTIKLKTISNSLSANTKQYRIKCKAEDLTPKNFYAGCNDDRKSVDIKWSNPNSKGLESYEIFRSENPRSAGQKINTALSWLDSDDSGKAMSYHDTGIVPGKKYYYTLKLNSTSGHTTLDIVRYSITCSPEIDLNPQDIYLGCSSNRKSIEIQWKNPNTKSLSSYKIYRSETPHDMGLVIKSDYGLDDGDGGKTGRYTDRGITKGKRYYYTIKMASVNGDISPNTVQYSISCGTSYPPPVPVATTSTSTLPFPTDDIATTSPSTTVITDIINANTQISKAALQRASRDRIIARIRERISIWFRFLSFFRRN